MTELPFLDHPLENHEAVIQRAQAIGQSRGLAKVVVAAAEEDDVLAALYACKQEKIAEAVLVGQPDNVKKALDIANVPEDAFELISTTSDEESAIRAAELAGSGAADVVMKGFLKTSVLLKTLLKHDYGLRDRELVSHSAVLYVPQYGGLLNLTDGGTLIQPSLKQKVTVIANAYQVMRAVGISRPSFAVMAPQQGITEEIPETLLALELVELIRDNWSDFLDIEGPVSLEKVSESTRNQGSKRPGDPDVLLAQTIEEGNILAKTLIQFGNAIFMGVITGARVPISLVSRSDSMMNKKSSIALAVCVADYQRRGFPSLPVISHDNWEGKI